MNLLAIILLVLLLIVALLGIYMASTRRRSIPRLQANWDEFPALKNALPQLAGLTGGFVQEGNEALIYQDGDLLEALKEAIEHAEYSVHLESYVWSKGATEAEFVELLCRKASQGVKVRLLVDALGAIGASDSRFEKLRAHGVELAQWHPISRFAIRRFNNRNHRKLLIVDGNVGFTFGHGIRDEWRGRAQDAAHWRDTGVRIRGPLVCALQVIFAKDWMEAADSLPLESTCFRPSSPCGSVAAHVVRSSKHGGYSSVALLYLLAIASAREEVLIQNPYFVPDIAVVKLFERAVARGVSVRLMLPGKHTDSRVVRNAGRHLYRRLLRAGVEIYEYQPTLLHQKIVVVDRLWSHIGSTNFDARSLVLNEEIGIGFMDGEIARQLLQQFDRDLQDCRQLDSERWEQRASWKFLLDRCAYLLHGQL